MGFLSWLSGGGSDDFEERNNLRKINNSPEAVKERVNYLRLTPETDVAALNMAKWALPSKAAELPREVSFRVVKQSCFIVQDSDDPLAFDYTDEDKWDIIQEPMYREHVLDKRMKDVAGRISMKIDGCRDTSRYESGVIMPVSAIPASEITFMVPDEAGDILDLSEAGRASIFEEQMREYFRQPSWRSPALNDLKYTTAIADDPVMPRYHIGINFHLDVRINGIEADRANLTITEQYRIKKAIENHKLSYTFESDGRELPEAVEEMSQTTYLMKTLEGGFGLSRSINNLSWYGYRDTAYAAAKRIVEEQERCAAGEQHKTKRTSR